MLPFLPLDPVRRPAAAVGSIIDRAPACQTTNTAWLAKGDNDRAIADFSAVIRLTPTDPDGFSNRGATWKLKGDTEHAIADLNKAIRLNPKDACAVYNRAAA